MNGTICDDKYFCSQQISYVFSKSGNTLNYIIASTIDPCSYYTNLLIMNLCKFRIYPYVDKIIQFSFMSMKSYKFGASVLVL